MSSLNLLFGFINSRWHEKFSREKMLKLQDKKFRKILKYAYKNSKFYRDLYSSSGLKESELDSIEIEKIPTVEKDFMMEKLDDVFTVDDITKDELLTFIKTNKNPTDLFKNKYHVAHTSGTTGTQGVFIYSKQEWNGFYPYITKTFDFNFKRKKTVYIGGIDGHNATLSFSAWLSKSIMKLFCNLLIININEPIEKVVEKLNEFQPDLLGGFFNEHKILAYQQKKGLLKIKPTTIVNCGEAVIPYEKEFIEKEFNAPLNNLYGFAECLIAGIGRSDYDGIYLMDDLALIELKKDHILLTNLFNKTQPIIRYRINDILTLKENKNNKTPFTVVENIIGRNENVIWFRNKKGKLDSIHPFLLVGLYIEGLIKFQVVLKNEEFFNFLAVIDEKNKERIIEDIKNKIDGILNLKNFSNVKYKILIVNDITLDKKTGKYNFIIGADKLKNPINSL